MHIEGFLIKKNMKGVKTQHFYKLEEQHYRLDYYLKKDPNLELRGQKTIDFSEKLLHIEESQ